ncbi:MAG: alpha/beta hydrolase [Akkermansiaceae bacterium]
MLSEKDFQTQGDKQLEWSKVSTFSISLTDANTKQRIKLTDVLTEMKASYPYLNPNFARPLPHKAKVPTVIAHTLKGNVATFTYKNNGAKVVRANLLYTDNGGHRYEEWYPIPAKLLVDGKVTATLPKGTTHYLINLIDENNYLISYPGGFKKDARDKKYSEYALKVKPTQKARPAKKAAAKKGTFDTQWTYKTVNGKQLKLDVFLPEGYKESKKPHPVFAVYHGGSWRSGEPNWHYPDCEYWRSRGMVAVSVAYRLKDRDNVQVPLECVKDAKTAIRFLRKNAQKLKIDLNKIVAAGGSAGGQLAAALGTITSRNTNDTSYDLAISCKPNAVVLYNPYFKCAAPLSPPQHVIKNLPPTITFLGGKDHAIPVADLLKFHNSLKAHGNASEYYVGIEGKHGFCNGRNPRNPYFYWSINLTDQFLVKHGMLTGSSKVVISNGVKRLSKGKDFQAHR